MRSLFLPLAVLELATCASPCRGQRVKLGGTAVARVASDSVTPRPARIRDSVLALALAKGIVRNLDSLPGGREQWIRLRVHQVPVEGTCIPEADAECGSYYVLAVRTAEGRIGAFSLGWLGQITDYQWRPPNDADMGSGTIRLTVTNYPSWVFEDQPSTRKVTKRFELKVSVDTVIVTELR